MKAAFAAQSAELDGITGMGCMAVRREGFRRCEGVFHCRLADRERIIAMMRDSGAAYSGIIYDEDEDIGRRTVPVIIRSFRSQHDGLAITLQARGEWWQELDLKRTRRRR